MTAAPPSLPPCQLPDGCLASDHRSAPGRHLRDVEGSRSCGPPLFRSRRKARSQLPRALRPNVTVEEGLSLGGFRAKPNSPSHYARDLGTPRDGESRPAGTLTGASGSPHLLDPLGEELKR